MKRARYRVRRYNDGYKPPNGVRGWYVEKQVLAWQIVNGRELHHTKAQAEAWIAARKGKGGRK